MSGTLQEGADRTRMGRAVGPRAARHAGASGVHPLVDSRGAFAARVLLARTAERTLDAQYYIWKNDLAGTLLLDALREAADRGVRVRFLLDDNSTAGLDPMLAALAAHPGIEVRLFNPFRFRRPRWMGFVVDFARLNRRMHNKSFTIDGEATIIGGRNIGDEYFDAAEGNVFVDLDVLAVGPVVAEVAREFERYWTSVSACPAKRLLAPADPSRLAELAAAASLAERDARAAAYMEALRETPFVADLLDGSLELDWVPVRTVSDDPAKVRRRITREVFLPPDLRAAIGEPKREVDLISAYFVPGRIGEAAFAALARRGVKVNVLTNSREATDVAVVHAGYAKRRKALLRAGVRLFELRRLSGEPRDHGERRLVGSSGSSASSLHAKTFSVDRERSYVGSFNFDPRSANLNTELGFVIESPALAQRIGGAFDEAIPQGAYEVRLSPTGALYWIERRDGNEIRHDTEPGTRVWQRLAVRLLSLLPIEWLL